MSGVLKNVVLLGASGNIGTPVLEELLKVNKFSITVISRESSQATFPAGVKVVKSDFSQDSLVSAFKGQDAVVSLVGAAALGDQPKYIDAALQAGVKRFFPSEYGIDTANPKVVELVPFLAGKGGIIKKLQATQDKLSWSAVITGAFFDWGVANGFLGYDLANSKARIWDGGVTKSSSSTLAQVGRGIAKILEHPDITANQFIYIQSFATSQNEVLASIEKATGKKFEITSIDAKAAADKALEQSKADPRSMEAIVTLLVAAMYRKDIGDPSDFNNASGGLWNKKLGLQEENLDDLIAGIVKK